MKKFNFKYYFNSFISYYILLIFFLSGCSTYDYLFKEGNPGRKEKFENTLKAYRDSVNYDISYIQMKNENESLIDSYVEIRGYIAHERPHEILVYTDPFYDENYGYYYLLIDFPIPKMKGEGKHIYFLSAGSKVKVIGRLSGIKDYIVSGSPTFLSDNGIVKLENELLKKLPMLKAIAIYILDDYEYENPYWVTDEILIDFGLKRK